MKKVVSIILFVLITIGVGFGGYYLGLKQEKNCLSQDQISQENLDDPNQGKSTEVVNPESLTYKDFSYNQLKSKYPASWIKSEIGDISTVAPKELIEKYKLTIPLLATTVDSGKSIQYTVSVYELSPSKSIDEIIKELVKDTSVNGAKGSIIAQNNFSSTESIYETRYEIGNTSLRTKEKLILKEADGKLYGVIASLQTPEQFYDKYQSLADYLLNLTLISSN